MTNRGRYNVLMFYQSLVEQIGQSEKIHILSSHIMLQLNDCIQKEHPLGDLV